MKKWVEILPLFLVRWLISFYGLELILVLKDKNK
jgi:hypothetical protein